MLRLKTVFCDSIAYIIYSLKTDRMRSMDLVSAGLNENKEVSVRAAAAEIIAADFYAAPTDSLLPKKIGSSCRQQGSAPIVC